MNADYKIAYATQSLNDLIFVLEWEKSRHIITDDVRHEILRMARFYKYCVTKGATPEAAAERAIEFVSSVGQITS